MIKIFVTLKFNGLSKSKYITYLYQVVTNTMFNYEETTKNKISVNFILNQFKNLINTNRNLSNHFEITIVPIKSLFTWSKIL